MNILFIASEADPFAKAGGLGDVAGALPKAIYQLNPKGISGSTYDIRLVLPFHPQINRQEFTIRKSVQFLVPSKSGPINSEAYVTDLDGVPVYLIKGAPIPEAGPLYSSMEQDGLKFTFFSRAALELARALSWPIDILHANDWHTAPAVYSLRRHYSQDLFLKNARSILSVHNLPFMGKGAETALDEFDLPPLSDTAIPWWGVNFPLVLGLYYADQIVAVSPGYAQEILHTEMGCGLQDFLQTRKGRITGILNGIDTKIWDPETDPLIPNRFSLIDPAPRQLNKAALQAEMGFPQNPDVPLLAFIGRMDPQKGVDLALNALRLSLKVPWQAILLGTGDPGLEEATQRLASDYPDRVKATLLFDNALSRRIYAGSDAILIPSRYEPCGLVQMNAMRYGCVPIARSTGGLRDTIVDYPDLGSTGFLFEAPDPQALSEAVHRALAVFPDRQSWAALSLRGMAQDFSWHKSALLYAELYDQILT